MPPAAAPRADPSVEQQSFVSSLVSSELLEASLPGAASENPAAVTHKKQTERRGLPPHLLPVTLMTTVLSHVNWPLL